MDEHVRVVLWAGFALGLVFGGLGQKIEFCFSGGLREYWGEKKPRRAAALLVAFALALLGSQLTAAAGLVDFHQSLYYPPLWSWLLVPFGGLLFGYGMIVARGCGSRALVLLGDGNLRSLVVLCGLTLGAGLTLTGLFANLRIALAERTSLELTRPDVGSLLASLGLPTMLAWLLPTLLLAGTALYLGVFRLGLRQHPGQAMVAAGIGLLVPLGWWVTGTWGADDFDPVPVESLTFVAPISNTFLYGMLSTGLTAGFGVMVVAGVFLGSLVTSLVTRSFELRAFSSPRQVLESLGGGLAMGIGGALALGCTVGQGLTGLSTLSMISMVAVAGILAGSYLALRGPLAWRD